MYVDEPAKWKTRELHQIHRYERTADPVAMDRKSCLYSVLEYKYRLDINIYVVLCVWTIPYRPTPYRYRYYRYSNGQRFCEYWLYWAIS